MYVYVMDENILHLRYARNDKQVVETYKRWHDMGHTPTVINKTETPNEQAH